MQQPTRHFFRAIACTAACVFAISAAWAQEGTAQDNIVAQAGDPARWYQEDMTPRGYFLTLKKEAGAAYQEAIIECKTAERTARAGCMRDARAQYEQDMNNARQQTHVTGR